MARKVTETLIDDVTGQEGEDVTEFTVPLPAYDENGALTTLNYVFDASPETQTKVREAIRKSEERYVRELAKSLKFMTDKVQPSTKRRGGVYSHLDREKAQAIREWAKQNGYTVADRGRIPNEVSEAYEAAHPEAA